MKTFHEEIPDLCQDALTDQLFDEYSIFFDIETTGFSPANSTLYMIGCARRKSNRICIEQFFAEKPEEEAEILATFFQMLSPYTTIITFNGVGFDIPYLKAKADHYKIPEHFRDFEYLDIFKSVSSIKFLLKLENYKQKTIESFLGLKREDEKTGGDLIHVYFTHVKHPTEETMHLLRIHNYEDVLHMIDLLSVLSYLEVLNGQYTILSHRIDHYHAYDGTEGEEWIITMQNNYPVPRQLSCKQDCFYLMIGKNRTSLRIPVYEGELHYFYSNYRDYYYLKKEDMAIHKSVASFVDKEYRENAKASNCYTRKSGKFLPIGGYTKLVENLLEGIEVRLNEDYLEDKEKWNAMAEKVVYTGAIDAYFDYTLGNLEYRSVRFENEILDMPNFQGNAAVNYTDRETPWTRIIEHKWFEFGKDENGNDLPKTIISKEYSSEWKPGDEPYYPVNDKKNGELYQKYKALAEKEENIIFGGRLGEYKYYDMDAVIASALECARNQLY